MKICFYVPYTINKYLQNPTFEYIFNEDIFFLNTDWLYPMSKNSKLANQQNAISEKNFSVLFLIVPGQQKHYDITQRTYLNAL